MTEDKSGEDRTARLRRLAQKHSRESAAEPAPTVVEKGYQRLVQELQVHQIELEMQNEELRMAQRQLSESLAKYSDLYDSAPTGRNWTYGRFQSKRPRGSAAYFCL